MPNNFCLILLLKAVDLIYFCPSDPGNGGHGSKSNDKLLDSFPEQPFQKLFLQLIPLDLARGPEKYLAHPMFGHLLSKTQN